MELDLNVWTWSMLGLVILIGLAFFFYHRRHWRDREAGLCQERDTWKQKALEEEQRRADLERELERLRQEGDRIRQALLSETEKRAALGQEVQRIPGLERELTEQRADKKRLQEELGRLEREMAVLETTLQKERAAFQEQLSAYEQAREKMSQAFEALAAQSLQKNTQIFLDLARNALGQFQKAAAADLEQKKQGMETLLSPLSQALGKYDQAVQAMERERQQAFARLSQQVESLSTAHNQLIQETGKLVKALRQPQVRGRWGELTLRRVVELAGMSRHCDFTEQAAVPGPGALRPDLVVHLPGERLVVVDAKVPLQGYLEAVEAVSEEDRTKHLQSHAKHLRAHVQQLASKNYWSQFARTPDFVVLFVPGEAFFSAALEQDPDLIETAMQQRVVLATPTTLIALLRAVAYGWQQQEMARNAEVISRLGRELHERLARMTSYLQDMGTHLTRAVDSYNRTVGALERRVLVSARRFQDLGIPTKGEIPECDSVGVTPRTPSDTTLPADRAGKANA
ncbi:DNA recombination protein RmuC [Desulfacinum hydrothermale DSM 13146]|uniref:DNA recombination protein RmuC n=1 Tax=Desulfacinum hydrothermale DSM 13146 TaxID=1121390 RepID=A0A1W1XHV8_9BACT|nr:DNA recombination protein RmuC [Desulfacinum hydrothermale]SMC23364.1 DNA recombination protein RmuC [Desulfacinum hydrothermale DSM 13146]